MLRDRLDPQPGVKFEISKTAPKLKAAFALSSSTKDSVLNAHFTIGLGSIELANGKSQGLSFSLSHFFALVHEGFFKRTWRP